MAAALERAGARVEIKLSQAEAASVGGQIDHDPGQGQVANRHGFRLQENLGVGAIAQRLQRVAVAVIATVASFAEQFQQVVHIELVGGQPGDQPGVAAGYHRQFTSQVLPGCLQQQATDIETDDPVLGKYQPGIALHREPVGGRVRGSRAAGGTQLGHQVGLSAHGTQDVFHILAAGSGDQAAGSADIEGTGLAADQLPHTDVCQVNVQANIGLVPWRGKRRKLQGDLAPVPALDVDG